MSGLEYASIDVIKFITMQQALLGRVSIWTNDSLRAASTVCAEEDGEEEERRRLHAG